MFSLLTCSPRQPQDPPPPAQPLPYASVDQGHINPRTTDLHCAQGRDPAPGHALVVGPEFVGALLATHARNERWARMHAVSRDSSKWITANQEVSPELKGRCSALDHVVFD
jgi:hypothetical protein